MVFYKEPGYLDTRTLLAQSHIGPPSYSILRSLFVACPHLSWACFFLSWALSFPPWALSFPPWALSFAASAPSLALSTPSLAFSAIFSPFLYSRNSTVCPSQALPLLQ